MEFSDLGLLCGTFVWLNLARSIDCTWQSNYWFNARNLPPIGIGPYFLLWRVSLFCANIAQNAWNHAWHFLVIMACLVFFFLLSYFLWTLSCLEEKNHFQDALIWSNQYISWHVSNSVRCDKTPLLTNFPFWSINSEQHGSTCKWH